MLPWEHIEYLIGSFIQDKIYLSDNELPMKWAMQLQENLFWCMRTTLAQISLPIGTVCQISHW